MADVDHSSELSPVKRALVQLKDMRARLDAAERSRTEPIAIVGIGCRFPGGARGPDAFWRLLIDGFDAIREVPADRWDVERYFDADPDTPGKMCTRFGGFLEGIDRFDADFFGITPREADAMDPQQRQWLEVAWEALEHGGIPPHALAGRPVAVFVGLSAIDYLQLELRQTAAERIDPHLATGGAGSIASGRLSYLLGLQGPSITVDTACSSSLVAVHLAMQSLRSRECELAVAGGSSAVLLPELTINFSRARMMASDGRCKTFDARADGYVRSEGCGAVVLKRLSDAIASGDSIVAVIRGSAVNQDGRRSSLTSPNGTAQQRVIVDALASAGVHASEVDFVEAHGTGTSLGDPIELRALGEVLGRGRSADRPLLVGSVKTNVGHLEAAAGVAGLIKAALSVHHAVIPPHLHFAVANPYVDWQDLRLAVPTARTEWPRTDHPRTAGVSSFGFGGTNAHLVVQQAPSAPLPERAPPEMRVLTVSARSDGALRRAAAALAAHLRSHPEQRFADVCYTRNAGRTHFAHRVAIVASSGDEAAGLLEQFVAGETAPNLVVGPAPGSGRGAVAYLFTGAELAPEIMSLLTRRWPAFRDALARVGNEVVSSFAAEYAMAELWRSWGIAPDLIVGHDAGAAVAATLAGACSVADAARVVAGSEGDRLALDPVLSDPLVPLVLSGFRRRRAASARPSDTNGTEMADASRELVERGITVVVDAGSMAAPSGTARHALRHGAVVDVISLVPHEDDPAALPRALAALYVRGVAMDWTAWDRPFAVQMVPLPSYSFERTRHWCARAAPAPGDDPWTKAAVAARDQATQGPLDLRIDTYPAKWAALDRLAVAYMAAALQELGLFARPGEGHSLADVCAASRIDPSQRAVVERWLGHLTASGVLTRVDDRFVADTPLRAAVDFAVGDETRRAFADAPHVVDLVERCGAALAAVAIGEVAPLDLLFPNGSVDVIGALYEREPSALYMNAIARAAVLAAAVQPGSTILEIGAGTGAMAAELLPRVNADNVSYVLTDKSKVFLDHARERFTSHPAARYALLDIDADPAAQGFASQAYDVIIASNVMHATRSLDRALDHVRSLLRPDGVLVLVETIVHRAWLDMTFGLTSGWNRFDDRWRAGHPLMDSARWSAALRAHGFDAVEIQPADGTAGAVIGQCAIIARGPAIVKRVTPSASLVREAQAPASPRAPTPETAFGRVLDELRDLPAAARREWLVDFVRASVISVLRVDPNRAPGQSVRLMASGMDSLMAVELRNTLARGLQTSHRFPATLIFDHPTIEAIAEYIDRLCLGEQALPRMQFAPNSTAPGSVTAAAIEQLDDDAVEAMINQRLEKI